MPRWGGWTSDLRESADPASLPMLIDDLGPWPATEYLRPGSAMQFDSGEGDT